MINRPRNETKDLLKVTGRDVEENEYGVKLLDGAWSLIGGSLNDAAAAAETIHKTINLGDRSTAIVEFVDKHPKRGARCRRCQALGIEADVAAP